jgi:MscS family membrane protein
MLDPGQSKLRGNRISEDRLNKAIYKVLINTGIEVPFSNIIIHFADQENRATISRQGKDFKDSR